MKDFPLPKSACVECGYIADGCSSLEGNVKPKPGDSSLCIKCASLNIFTDNLTLRMPTTDEMCESAINVELQTARRTILAIRKRMEEE